MRRVTDLTTLRWPKVWRQYFKPIEGEDLGIWQVALERMWEADEELIIRAIHALGEDPRAPKYPGLGNLKFHIRAQAEAVRADAPAAEPCGLCHAYTPGYMVQENWPVKVAGGRTIQTTVTTPCCCTLGQQQAKIWAKQSDHEFNEVYTYLQTKAAAIRDFRRKNAAPDTHIPEWEEAV